MRTVHRDDVREAHVARTFDLRQYVNDPLRPHQGLGRAAARRPRGNGLYAQAVSAGACR